MPTIDILGNPHAYDLYSPTPPSDAPTLVFIHGWLLSRHYWHPLMAHLPSKYPCLTYDLRGFGDSTLVDPVSLPEDPQDAPSHSPYSLAAYAQDLTILLDKLAIDNVWLVGHSLGGSIALWGAYLCPDRVRGVICLNAGGGIYLKEEFDRFRSFGKRLVAHRPRWLMSAPLLDWVFARMMVDRPLDIQWGKQRVMDFVKADSAAALGTLLDSTTESEVHLLPQIVSQLSQSVYFIAGAKDTVMEPKYVNYLASFHPYFAHCANNVIEIPHCGHLSLVEYPDIVARYLSELLQAQTEVSRLDR